MNLFELFVKISVDDQASKKLKKISGNLEKGLATAAKIGTAAVAVASTGIVALTTAAINSYAEYEQLVGGVETLFKESADAVKEHADEAFRSAGLSANKYMATVTSFSASLLQSLGRGEQTDLDALQETLDEEYEAVKKSWDDRIKLAQKYKQRNVDELIDQRDAELKALEKTNEQRLADAEAANNKSVVTAETQKLAADLANQAVIDMADNAAKMGTAIEMIQNAYAGFAKQNYTMLDNLKLGYGGTKTEMERLVKDAAALDSSIDANSLSFDNIVKAIHVVQTEMGITGTTAREAGTTIQGSIGAMKAAWENLLTGFSDKSANIPQLVNNLVTSIVGDGTENNLGVLGNILPAIETALGGVSEIIKVGVPKILEEIIPVIGGSLPIIAETAMYLVTSLADGISSALPTLFDTVIDAVNQIADVFMSDEGLSAMFDAAITLLTTFLETFTSAEGLEKFNNALFNLVDSLFQFLLKPETIALLIEAGIQLIVSMTVGMLAQRLFLFKTMGKLLLSIGEAVVKTDWAELGKNVVSGFRKGIENSWKNLKNWFKSLFGDLIAVAKKILGIASPSKVFKKLGFWTADGFGIGFEDEFAHVKDDMEDALNFDDANVGINASIRKVGAGASSGSFGGTSIGNININIDGAKYDDEQSLALAVAEAIQGMTDRRYAVYA